METHAVICFSKGIFQLLSSPKMLFLHLQQFQRYFSFSLNMRIIQAIILSLLLSGNSFACLCEEYSVLSKQECSKYGVIFQGTVSASDGCDNGAGKVLFSIQELYKGATSREQEIVLECKKSDCPLDFELGDDWLIFAQKNNAQEIIFDPCSRSRKLLPDSVKDYFTELTGLSYFQEQAFLQQNFTVNAGFDGNLKARKYEKVDPKLIPVFLGVSLLFMIIGIFAMRYFKKRKA